MLITSLTLAVTCVQVTDPTPATTSLQAIGSGTGTAQRALIGRVDPSSMTPDLLVLQGTELLMHLDPSFPTLDWATHVTADTVYDFALSNGGNATDVVLTVGPDGLVARTWSGSTPGAFDQTLLAAGSWTAATKVWACEEGGVVHVFGLEPVRGDLLRVDLLDLAVTTLPHIDAHPTIADIAAIQWDGQGADEFAVLDDGHAVFILNAAGAVVASIPVATVGTRMAVSRGDGASVPDLLLVTSPSSGVVPPLLVAARSDAAGNVVYRSVVVLPADAHGLRCGDFDGDSLDDAVVALDLLTEGGPATHAQFVRRIDSDLLDPAPAAPVPAFDDSAEGSVASHPCVSDVDNDGDLDVVLTSGDVDELHTLYGSLVDASAHCVQFQPPTPLYLATSTGPEVALSYSVSIDGGAGQGDVQQATHLLVEVWRMGAEITERSFDTDPHRFGAVPFDPAQHNPLTVVLSAAPNLALDDHAYRIDLTPVILTGGAVTTRFGTKPTWFASDAAVESAIRGAVKWPFDEEIDPGNTIGPIENTGPPIGSGPPGFNPAPLPGNLGG